ncbi:heterokaryon incompatibility protein-domain-containing protein [Cercophora samala]|uniref:Heterokaryon incompatibility protein-domain-containing protein n=1 Tax=Cercophora samala TaxID=330535 RepID=A0AA39YKA5_9PEZI|nr:heterokaryon incompatibility protein-domain-containing protein [Cercophora samala]
MATQTATGEPSASIPDFGYRSLADPSHDIRILHLLPGDSEDSIQIQIEHVYLPSYNEKDLIMPSQKATLERVQKTLPADWTVHETIEGRLIYNNDDPLVDTSWEHPTDPNFQLPEVETPSVPGAPVYEALSYTWGSATETDLILVQHHSDATSTRGKLSVTQNLATALRHLRRPLHTRTLWIDAICINQQDEAERNKQVHRMTDIYRLANRLVVWLGPEADNSKHALSTLHYLSEQVDITRTMHQISRPGSIQRGTMNWYALKGDLPYDQKTWQALQALFYREWFTRVWILQEITLAHSSRAEVQCGNDVLPWPAMRRAIICLSTKNTLPSAEFRDRVGHVRRLAEYNPAYPLSRVVRYFDDRQCSNPSDRVYGLLGLMSASLRARIRVDYALPPAEVYKLFALAQMDHFGRLDPLVGCSGLSDDDDTSTTTADMPTWVPDLRTPPFRPLSRRGQFSSGMSRSVTHYISPNVLQVRGVHAGEVATVRDEMAETIMQGLQVVRKWQLRDMMDNPYPGGGTFLQGLAWTLSRCGMITRNRVPWNFHYQTIEEWTKYCRDTIIGGEGPIEGNEVVNTYIIDAVSIFIFQRKLFFTRDGLVGLGPKGMRSGDTIAVLLGFDAPVVLRDAGDGKYHFVGESMVWGLHDATALLGPLPPGWSVQVMLDQNGHQNVYRYFNSNTNHTADDDPRLDPLPSEWERVSNDRTLDDPDYFDRFRNKTTGEVVNFDPRMSVEALRQRGVALTTFALV